MVLSNLQKKQLSRIKKNLCVECGLKEIREDIVYIIYPFCCRDCALKLYEQDKIIKVYAENYHNPISDLRGFNKILRLMKIPKVNENKLRVLLNY